MSKMFYKSFASILSKFMTSMVQQDVVTRWIYCFICDRTPVAFFFVVPPANDTIYVSLRSVYNFSFFPCMRSSTLFINECFYGKLYANLITLMSFYVLVNVCFATINYSDLMRNRGDFAGKSERILVRNSTKGNK